MVVRQVRFSGEVCMVFLYEWKFLAATRAFPPPPSFAARTSARCAATRYLFSTPALLRHACFHMHIMERRAVASRHESRTALQRCHAAMVLAMRMLACPACQRRRAVID